MEKNEEDKLLTADEAISTRGIKKTTLYAELSQPHRKRSRV